MSLYAFHLGQIISTVLGQVDHDGQHGNAARTPIRGETSETDHTQKRRFRHTAIYQTIKALAILRCLYGSEMVLLGVVIGKCEMPSTNISQENGHEIINNYWMRLSMISRIIQTEVNVICRSEAEADNIDRGLNNS